jgi:hypothetical protein
MSEILRDIAAAYPAWAKLIMLVAAIVFFSVMFFARQKSPSTRGSNQRGFDQHNIIQSGRDTYNFQGPITVIPPSPAGSPATDARRFSACIVAGPPINDPIKGWVFLEAPEEYVGDEQLEWRFRVRDISNVESVEPITAMRGDYESVLWADFKLLEEHDITEFAGALYSQVHWR